MVIPFHKEINVEGSSYSSGRNVILRFFLVKKYKYETGGKYTNKNKIGRQHDATSLPPTLL